MADSLGFEIKGLDAVNAKLKAVAEEPKKKSFRFALRKAANIVRDAAQARAREIDDPETANSIPDNVVVRFDGGHFRQTGDMKMAVGVKGGAKKGDVFYWRFHEFGTEKMKATPFLRPAMEESIQPATDEFVKHADRALSRAIKRAKRGK